MAQKTMTLTVDTGAVLIDVQDKNGKKIGEFSFNPADSGIFSRYGQVVDYFNGVDIPADLSDEEKLEKLKSLDEDIKRQFDFLLGEGVSAGIFGSCGPLTVNASGDFFFENVLEGIGGLIERVMDQRLDKKLKKINAAARKYGK